MDSKNLLTAVVLSTLILLGWYTVFPPEQPKAPAQIQTNMPTQPVQTPASLNKVVPITVHTDTVKAVIDEKSGDLRGLTLLKYNSVRDEKQDFVLLNDSQNYTYVAQSSLLDANGQNILKDVAFTAPQKDFKLNGNQLEVRLSAPPTQGLQIDKVYTFNKDSYLINVRFDVKNTGAQAVKLGTNYTILRDNSAPDGSGWFTNSYNGPVVYTPEAKFQKVPFKDLDKDFQAGKDSVEYQRKATGGYVGMIQHYFMSTWLLQTYQANSNICANGACIVDIKRRNDNLYSAGVNVGAVEIAPGASKSFMAGLYAGPQTTRILNSVAPNLDLAKDYGRVHIFAAPLFALLNWLHGLVGNWGWSIILLTLLVKAVLFPLNNSAYKSMAKMRTVAPKMEAIKQKYGEDKMGMQQAMMQLYRDEKVNPLGGCLPMLIQMPIFIGLYWMIFLSVELRQAPWLGWISDLSRQDPFYILPILMMVTMWFQTTLNPPPSDPTQAKMMKIMPFIFSFMFFFFPSGLVLYYVVNNLLTIVQQRYINHKINLQTANGVVLDKQK